MIIPVIRLQHHTKLGNKHDSATNYVDAANCYKKSDPNGKNRKNFSLGKTNSMVDSGSKK